MEMEDQKQVVIFTRIGNNQFIIFRSMEKGLQEINHKQSFDLNEDDHHHKNNNDPQANASILKKVRE